MAPSFVQVAVSALFASSALAISSSNTGSVLAKRAPEVPTVLPGTWQYQGCYTDGAPRTLTDATYASGTLMTVESCIDFCNTRGFIFAGAEYAQECFCGNKIANGGVVAPPGDCSMACTGDADEACGGPGRLSIFWNGSDPPPGPSHNPGTLGFGLLGCYTEGINGRALTHGAAITGDLTIAKCIASCKTAGYTFAGAEYANECYCGNSLSNGADVAPEGLAGCNLLCKGNSAEFCGAGNRLDVYQLDLQGPSSSSAAVSSTTTSRVSASVSTTLLPSSVSSATTSASPVATLSHKATIGAYTFQGCYSEIPGGRALAGAAFYSFDAMTLNFCATKCAAFTYFGVEYGGECFCGNTLNVASVKGANTECSFTCPGNPFQYCGAGNRLELYKLTSSLTSTSAGVSSSTSVRVSSSVVVPSSSGVTTTSSVPIVTGLPTGWKYGGCYKEGTTGRALTVMQPGGPTNSVNNCINRCISQGYKVAGMEYGEQCFCDNFVSNGGVAANDETKCSMNCPGNPLDKCGAGDILSLYYTGTLTTYKPPAAQKEELPGSWVYDGCWTDNLVVNPATNIKMRGLIWQTVLTLNNTATSCLSLCSKYGYMSGGMQYGTECFCGDHSNVLAIGAEKRPDSECTTLCSGDRNYYCGGNDRTSYYRWTGAPLYVWNTPVGYLKGLYQFLIGGVVVPLITTAGINDKIVFMEKSGTGAPNTTGTYELDLAFINDFSKAWRPLRVKTDIFCAAGITLPDKAGRQLNIGGWSGDSTFGVRLYWPDGSPGVPGINNWQEDNANLRLKDGRWYPSALNLANGSVLVIGGEVGSNSAATPTLEILPPPPGGYSKYLDWLERTDPNNLYPFLWILPSGGIFIIYWNEARILDEKTFDTIKTLPNAPGAVNNFLGGRTYPLEGTGVMLPLIPPYTASATFMACGGSAFGMALDNCVSIQPEKTDAEWVIERMPSQRVLSCMVALPDGTFLILNGAKAGVAGFGLANTPNLQAVLYDPTKPVNTRMSIMATTIVARMYHSEAILLPDGRVLVSGSNPEDGKNPEEYRVETFSPPYALNGLPKPVYTINTKDWPYGRADIVKIQTTIPSGPASGIRVSMMAAVSSTHGNSMGQRTIFLNAACTASGLCSITTPPSAHVAPPGWYQVFLLDGPTPGKGIWVRIGGEVADAAGIGNWPNNALFQKPGLGPVGS